MEALRIFETHAHYDDEAFDEDRDELLSRMEAGGIRKIIDVAASIESLPQVVALAEKYPFMYAAVGIHPDDADKVTAEVLEEVTRLTCHDKVVAVGEIGLDYYWHKEAGEHERQQSVFRAQLAIARQAGLPFLIHSREACQDTLEIIREFMDGGMPGGVLHCFSYSWETAKEYLSMGLYLGIGGVVTFQNARKLKEVVEKAPLSRLVLETDCPYLSPVPHRGKRNHSLNLPLVLTEIARIKNLPEETVADTLWENACRLFPRAGSNAVPV